MSPESQAGSADLFVDRLTELLDAHVVRPRPAGDTAGAGRAPAAADPAGAALLAQLTAATTWGEPPAELRDTVLARVLGAGAAPARPAEVPDAEPDEDDEDEEPEIAATAAPVVEPAVEPERAPEPPAEPVAEPAVEPAEPEATAAPAVEPDAGPDAGPDATERVTDEVPGPAVPELPAVPQAGAVDEAKVVELRPRWQRLTWAVPMAAAAAAVFTLAVIGVQQVLEPDAPAGVTYSASGTPLAPDATGKVTVAKAAAGFSVVIDVKELPAAAPGSYYIAWLRGPDGVVPLGSFHARQIAKPITLWSGVDPALYPAFSVTLQREGAPPTPSGVTVLRGQLTNP